MVFHEDTDQQLGEGNCEARDPECDCCEDIECVLVLLRDIDHFVADEDAEVASDDRSLKDNDDGKENGLIGAHVDEDYQASSDNNAQDRPYVKQTSV